MQVSSIHGFGHIVATRRYSRLFWILVVIFGFSVASYLINLSFSDWSESPISTTIETLPISKLKFPKVLVCPPKNTRTNLNYDLILSENLTLDDEGKKEFAEFIKESLLDIIYNSIYEEVKSYRDIENFRNWYDGITMLELPMEDWTSLTQTAETTKIIRLRTYAKSGTFVTPNFRETFHFLCLLKSNCKSGCRALCSDQRMLNSFWKLSMTSWRDMRDTIALRWLKYHHPAEKSWRVQIKKS